MFFPRFTMRELFCINVALCGMFSVYVLSTLTPRLHLVIITLRYIPKMQLLRILERRGAVLCHYSRVSLPAPPGHGMVTSEGGWASLLSYEGYILR